MALLEKLTLGRSYYVSCGDAWWRGEMTTNGKLRLGGRGKTAGKGGKSVSCGVVIPELLGRHRDRSRRLTSGAVRDV
jgi:hypothetical protein